MSESQAMPYFAAVNFNLPREVYHYAIMDGHCKFCGGRIENAPDRIFYKDAPYGFTWVVSSAKSGLCAKCFDQMEAESRKPSAPYVRPTCKVVYSEWKANGHYMEIIEEEKPF